MSSSSISIARPRSPTTLRRTPNNRNSVQRRSKIAQGGRRLFDILYEQFVRNIVNPQRRPQLASELTFALPSDTKSGWVWYDDCREATGAMIEAKGNYANFLSSSYGKDRLTKIWLDQAQKQIHAAGTKPIEWYFHDASAAEFASALFGKQFGGRISVHWLPYPPGVPVPNPRIR